MKTILVLDGHLNHALVAIQSLGAAGHAILAASDQENPIGFRSRYVRQHLVCPDISKDIQGFGDWLCRVLDEHAVDLILPVSDRSGRALVEVESRLPASVVLALPPRAAYLRSLDKLDTLEAAGRMGVPAPRYVHLKPGDAIPGDASLPRYPIVLKPRSSVLCQNNQLQFFRVSYAEDRRALEQNVSSYAARVDLLLQEYVHGEGVGVEVLRLPGGPLHACFQHRRLREMPLTGGGSTCRIAVPVDPKLLAYTESLLEDLGWSGLAMVEFKTGAAGDFLMEINGRMWGSLALAVRAGVDFPRLLAAMHLGEALLEPPVYQVGHRCIKVPADLNWIAEVIRGHGLALGLKPKHAIHALLDYVSPWKRSFDGITVRDPLPGMILIREACRRFLPRR